MDDSSGELVDWTVFSQMRTELGALAEEIEFAGRRAVESGLFPDHVLPQVAKLRPIYAETISRLEAETNPLVARRQGFGRKPSNQEFGRI